MRILIYGDAGPATGGWCYAETLREIGHEVSQFPDPDSSGLYRSLPSRFYRKMFKRMPELHRRQHISFLNSEVKRFQPSIIIVQKGLHLSYDDVMSLRQGGRWICNVNHDDFFSANQNNWSQTQRHAIPAYNYIFTTRSINVEEVFPFNPNVEFFPFAYYPRIHRLLEIPPGERNKWDADVVFVGTYEKPRAALLEQLALNRSLRLVVHGAQWSKLSRSSPLRKYVCSSDLRFDELCKAVRGARISLGFLRKENRDDYTQRTFEIPACGGLLLAERTNRHLSYFKEGLEAEFFNPDSTDELCEKIFLLLNDPERRERIRLAGYEAVLRGQHTYKDRLQRLLQVYNQTKMT
jgi:spore maturation protein CgeB